MSVTRDPSFDSAATQALASDSGELLLVPGPVSLGAVVQRELQHPVRPHYGPAWVSVFEETTSRLKDVFQTNGDVVLFFGPGSAALETSFHSCLGTRDRLLVPTNGVFGERLAAIAEASGVEVVRAPFPANQAIRPEAVREAAIRCEATALGIVYSETGSALFNPLQAICAEANKLGLFTIVDAVSALGGLPLDVERWKIDICVAVGNKCLGAPVGISPIAVSDAAWARCRSADLGPRGWYFNLETWRDERARRHASHPHPTTMPTSVVHGLNAAAEVVLRDLPGFIERHASVASLVRDGLRELGFRLYIEDERYASPVVTAAYALEDMDLDHYIAWLGSACRMRISAGLGTGDTPVFRVGHMSLAADPEVAAAYLDVTRRYLEGRLPT